jgi:hypothetical protein
MKSYLRKLKSSSNPMWEHWILHCVGVPVWGDSCRSRLQIWKASNQVSKAAEFLILPTAMPRPEYHPSFPVILSPHTISSRQEDLQTCQCILLHILQESKLPREGCENLKSCIWFQMLCTSYSPLTSSSSWTAWPLKMGPIGYPKTSVRIPFYAA